MEMDGGAGTFIFSVSASFLSCLLFFVVLPTADSLCWAFKDLQIHSACLPSRHWLSVLVSCSRQATGILYPSKSSSVRTLFPAAFQFRTHILLFSFALRFTFVLDRTVLPYLGCCFLLRVQFLSACYSFSSFLILGAFSALFAFSRLSVVCHAASPLFCALYHF